MRTRASVPCPDPTPARRCPRRPGRLPRPCLAIQFGRHQLVTAHGSADPDARVPRPTSLPRESGQIGQSVPPTRQGTRSQRATPPLTTRGSGSLVGRRSSSRAENTRTGFGWRWSRMVAWKRTWVEVLHRCWCPSAVEFARREYWGAPCEREWARKSITPTFWFKVSLAYNFRW